MKGNINLISYDCYQQATEKQLAGLKWKENRVYYISEIHNEKMQDEIYGYIDDRCRRLSLSTVVNDIYRFDLLKEFLNEKCTSCSSITDKKWEELERSYKAFLYKKGLALYVRRNRPDRRNVEQQSSAQISFLKMYYEYDNALPEAYSDAEIRRFNCALTKLKPQLGRCLIIHQMLGTRIEDTLTLRRDCLSEKSGHYFITIIQQKTRKYKRPVSDQLAELIRKAIEVSEKEHPDSEYIFLQDNGKLYTDSMLKYHVNIMIYENDIRDDKGNYFEFRTHRFRHTFGVKLTEMKLDDDSIARLLGHKDTRTIPHYRRLRNEALAEDTKAVRDEMNELLAQYRREKENAETR